MAHFLKQIFRRENIINVLIIAAAVVTVFEVPQSVGVGEEKILLALLGLLALDGLIEKTAYLERIEEGLKSIRNIVSANPNAVSLTSRDALPPFSESVSGANNVFVFAISAHSLVGQHYTVILNALKEGTHFRFVLVSPDNQALEAAPLASASSTDTEIQVRWIYDTLNVLGRLAQNDTRGTLEVKLFKGIPTTSLIAYDTDRQHGWFQIDPHYHRRTPLSRPTFTLKASSGSEWFKYYQELIEDVWNDSVEFDLKA